MMARKKSIGVLIGIIVIAVISALFSLSGNPKKMPLEKVVFGVSKEPSSGPLFVAYKKGFFRDEGIDAALHMYQTGKAAFSAMEDGTVRFATVADTVLMFAGLDRKKIAAVATIADTSRDHKVIALKSSGISTAVDLRGKKIGVTQGTSGEFFLYSLLLFHGIPLNGVRLVYLSPKEMLSALQDGRVDAVATWNPTASVLAEELRERALVLEDSGYLMTWNLVSAEEWIQARPEAVVGVLRALIEADRYMAEHPREAAALTARFCECDQAILERDWGNYHFSVRLGEALVINLEDQARWALKLRYRTRRAMPDYTQFIYTDALRAVDPDAVALPGIGRP